MNINGITALPGAFAGAVNLIQLPENISGIVDTSYMLSGATSYNARELETWDFTDTVNMSGMLDDCGFDPDTYNSFIMTLAEWVTETGASGRVLGAANVWWGDVELSGYTYSGVVEAREYLESGGWSVSGDAEAMVLVIDTNYGTDRVFKQLLRYNADCSVYWGDGEKTDYYVVASDVLVEHEYDVDGIYNVITTGYVKQLGSINTAPYSGYNKLIVEARSLGEIGLTNMDHPFASASNISKVFNKLPTTMNGMRAPFRYITHYDLHEMSEWDLSEWTGSIQWTCQLSNFNQPINDWNVRNIWDFEYLFRDAYKFNQPLDQWQFNTLTPTNYAGFDGMFSDARAFNQPLPWDVYNVRYMGNMFNGAIAFNQDIGSWNLNKSYVTMPNMLNNCGMSVENYSRTLIGWANYVYNSGAIDGPLTVTLGATTLEYNDVDYLNSGQFTNAKDAHDFLTTTVVSSGAGWIITDNGCEEIPGAMYLQVDTSLIDGNTIELPLNGTVDATIYWGDDSTTVASGSGALSHTYSTEGDYLVGISGTLTQFGSGVEWSGSPALTKVYSFGEVGIDNLTGAFAGASNLEWLPVNVSGVTDISYMLSGASNYNGTELTTWSISGITNASGALDDTAISLENYSQILVEFANQVYDNAGAPSGIALGASGLGYDATVYGSGEYTDAVTARAYLVDTASWTINGDTWAFYALQTDGGDNAYADAFQTLSDDSSQVSVAVWAYCVVGGSYPCIVRHYYPTGTNRSWQLIRSSKPNVMYSTNGDDVNYGITASSEITGWNHIAFTYNAGTFKLYINGELKKTDITEHVTLNQSPYKIEALNEAPNGNAVTQIYIANVAWTAEEVAAIYASVDNSEARGLVAGWRMDPIGDGTTFTDVSGNGRTLKKSAAAAAPTTIGPFISLPPED